MKQLNTQINTQKLVMTGLMTAIIAVATMAIAVPVPFTNGYIHLGDSMIFLSVLILGWRYGAFAAGVGSAMADMLLGYVHWMPWTFVIKALMAVIMGFIIEKAAGSNKFTAIFCGAIGLFWLLFNFIVQKIMVYESVTNGAALYEDAGAVTPGDLAVFIGKMQSQLMLIAIIIPVILLIIVLVIKKTEHIIIPIYQVVAMTATGMWMVFGYYIAGGVLYGNFAISAFSIPANMIQFAMGFTIAMLVAAALYKTPANKYFAYKVVTQSK